MKKSIILLWAFLLSFAAMANLPDATIDSLINAHRPLNGGVIPSDIRDRLGVTHVGGKYCLTQEPYLIEGTRQIANLGYKVMKYFVGSPNAEGELSGYGYHSDWNLPKDASPVDVLSHPYFRQALEFGQKCVVFNIGSPHGQLKVDNPDFTSSYQEIYDAAVYLLKTYRDREITFILKNWEGDWLLRGLGTSKQKWMAVPAQERSLRVKNMTEWFRVRQQAVSDARAKVKRTKAKIYFAVEVNKPIESMAGITGIASDILPNITVDMVSWSSYDGMNDPRKMFRGIGYLREQLHPTPYMKGRKEVIIGEIGIPENVSKRPTAERWDELFGAIFAQDVRLVIDWEIYCNEPKDGRQNDFKTKRTAEDMRGFWMIRPDGSKSETCLFWEKLMNNGGKTIN